MPPPSQLIRLFSKLGKLVGVLLFVDDLQCRIFSVVYAILSFIPVCCDMIWVLLFKNLNQSLDCFYLKPYNSQVQPPSNQHASANQSTTATGVSNGVSHRPPAVPLFSQSDLQMYKQQVYNNFVNNYAPVYSPTGKNGGKSLV